MATYNNTQDVTFYRFIFVSIGGRYDTIFSINTTSLVVIIVRW